MDTPNILINLKTYEQGSGEDALDLAVTCEKAAKMADASIAVAVQNADIRRIAQIVDIPVIAQHMDPAGQGPYTGKDVAETLAFNGADGVLINHSEDQIPLEDIEVIVERAQANDLTSIVAVDVPEMIKRVEPFKPDIIAFEPPELIGGKTSVATAEPGLIKEAVDTASRPLLVGAGIKDGGDVRTSKELGAAGILVASGVVKADDPETALQHLVEGV